MFNQKDYYTNMAKDTIDIINKGFYINKNRKKILLKDKINDAVSNTELFELEDIFNTTTSKNKLKNIKVINSSTIDSVIDIRAQDKESHIVILNFASAKHPGGGFLRGSIAQEESIARSSTMYPCLLTKEKEFYNYNLAIANPLYTDKMIYSPNVLIIKNNKGEVLDEPVECSIITSPAVNATIAKERGISNKEIDTAMKKRIEKIIELAIIKKADILILGAFGCGVFGNDVDEVAKIFYKTLNDRYEDLKDMEICFSIYDKDNKILNKFEKELMKDE